jgi:hypothetical protein
MREPLSNELDRWTREGLIGRDQAERIRAFEAARVPGVSWPVPLPLVFGGVLIAAGISRFRVPRSANASAERQPLA